MVSEFEIIMTNPRFKSLYFTGHCFRSLQPVWAFGRERGSEPGVNYVGYMAWLVFVLGSGEKDPLLYHFA